MQLLNLLHADCEALSDEDNFITIMQSSDSIEHTAKLLYKKAYLMTILLIMMCKIIIIH